MARKHADALPTPERRRAEALALAIAMQPGRYPHAADYFRDAEEIEAWLKEAHGEPPPYRYADGCELAED